MKSATCNGNEARTRRSVVALTVSCSTPSGHCADSKGDAVMTAARDGNEVGIRRRIVALTETRSTPRDHGAIGSESDAVKTAACDGD